MKPTSVMKHLCLFFGGLLLAAGAGPMPATGIFPAGHLSAAPQKDIDADGWGGLRFKFNGTLFAADDSGQEPENDEVEEEDNGGSGAVPVESGQGLAVVEFSFTPEAELVIVTNLASPDAAGFRLDPPWRLELSGGRYRVEARAAGHLPLAKEFEVASEEPVRLELQFTPEPTSAPLLIITQPPGAELFLDGEPVGKAPQTLESLEFGTYRIGAYLNSDEDNRVVFEGNLVFNQESPGSLELTLEREQRRFEGEWYEQAVADRLAAEAEEKAYRKARIRNPVEIRLKLAALGDKKVTRLGDFSRDLFRLLRVGDRLRVELAGRKHLVWKRSRQRSAAFRNQVRALWTNRPIELKYAKDPARVILVEPGGSLVGTVGYRLYRRANDQPLLDLGRAMHELQGITLHTLAPDGLITLLTFGGRNVAVNGRSLRSTAQLGVMRLKAADRKLELTWEEAPQRVLVVSRKNTVLKPAVASVALNLNQKELVDLGAAGRVQSFHRFSRHPDGRWRHVAKEPPIGLPVAMDLNSDEVGPHPVSGQYKREWLIEYETAEGKRATRQVPMDYTVGEVAHPVRSTEFIRR